MQIVIGLICGIVFGAGLAVSDMINPARVLNFLDLAGHWDPTLAFVMAGGLAVAGVGYRMVFRRSAPLFDAKFHLPVLTQIDARLLGGAALFGIGWGMAGFCPGPAIAALVTLNPKALLFVIAMAAGMLAAHRLRRVSPP